MLNVLGHPKSELSEMRSKSLASRSVRVLLIDDHRALAEATAEFLRFSGLDVRTAFDGKEALVVAKAFGPQLVLCDLRLPDASGLDVLQTLRATLDAKQVILALHTALGDEELRSFQRHADIRVVSKPLTEPKLKRLLDELRNSSSS